VASSNDKDSARLGPLENEVVRAVWAAGEPITVRALLDRLNKRRRKELAYTTAMTVMNRLVEKGVLRREKQGRGYAYEAVADDAAGLAVHGVVREFGDAAIASFVEEARADPKLLRRLEGLLDEER
jgi:predicted transcriptional regulator